MQKQLILLYFEGYLYQKEPPGVKGNRISLIKPWICWILNQRCTDSDLHHIIQQRKTSSRVTQNLYICVCVSSRLWVTPLALMKWTACSKLQMILSAFVHQCLCWVGFHYLCRWSLNILSETEFKKAQSSELCKRSALRRPEFNSSFCHRPQSLTCHFTP